MTDLSEMAPLLKFPPKVGEKVDWGEGRRHRIQDLGCSFPDSDHSELHKGQSYGEVTFWGRGTFHFDVPLSLLLSYFFSSKVPIQLFPKSSYAN